MAYFKDFDLLSYQPGVLDAKNWKQPLIAIGWIEGDHGFPIGVCAKEVLSKFRSLREDFGTYFPKIKFRGGHHCAICQAIGNPIADSHINLFVPTAQAIYCVPGGMDHYVEIHSYLPPLEFTEALLNCPAPGTDEYALALFRSNGGVRPPLFPEKWVVMRLGENKEHIRIAEFQSEREALEMRQIFIQRGQDPKIFVEKLPDQWNKA